MEIEMKTKNLMVSLAIVAMALVLVSTVSAATTYEVSRVTVEGIGVTDVVAEYSGTDPINSDISIVADETVTVKVYFEATSDDGENHITVYAEMEGDDYETEAETASFDVVEGSSVHKEVLNIKVPKLKDATTGIVELNIEIDDEKIAPILLKVQSPSYDVDFKSVRVADQNIEAGETVPVDLLVKNIGYNDLEDLYVTAKISELGVEETFYFGDLITVDSEDDGDNSFNKRIFLDIPADAVTGIYTLEIELSNEDTIINKVVEVSIKNNVAIKSGSELVLLNPTNKPVAYRIVYNEKEIVEAVSAGESVRVPIEVPAGEYSFDVNVFSMDGNVIATTNFSGESTTNVSPIESPIVILTVVLAIVFLVLLVVLIVLVTKKPEKTDEFGESYY